MRVLVCGGRHYRHRKFAYAALDQYAAAASVIIHGDATGADRIARQWAIDRGIKPLPFPAKWTDLSHPDAWIRTRADGSQYDAKAGARRNHQMLDEGKPDRVIAFPGGGGTAHMVRIARAAGIEIIDLR